MSDFFNRLSFKGGCLTDLRKAENRDCEKTRKAEQKRGGGLETEKPRKKRKKTENQEEVGLEGDAPLPG